MTAAAAAVTAVLCIGMLAGNLIRKDSLLDIVLRQAKSEAYVCMLKSTAPALFYEKKEKDGIRRLMEMAFRVIPVYGYVTDEEEYATQSESQISYESIIAKEAADENYVDEATGEVVTVTDSGLMDGMEQENSDDTDKKNKKTKKEKKETAPAVFVPNQTPLVNYSKDRKSVV